MSIRRSGRSIPRISLATVYKSLEALVAIGVATKLTAGIGATRARYDARRDMHYHFRCLRTGTVHDLPTQFDPELVAKLDPRLADYLNRQGLQVTGYRLELIGYQDRPPNRRPKRLTIRQNHERSISHDSDAD